MLSLTRSFAALRPFGGSPIASTSRAAPSLSSSSSSSLFPSTHPTPSFSQQIRHKGNLAPKRTKYRKAHKGRVPLPSGGSTKGTTLAHGSYGLRLLAPARLSAKQLESAETALKRHLKVLKGAQVYMRVFPDVPVCVKGNETRMGKGKGSFEFWACRAGVGKVVFEIGGPLEIREEVAKAALRLASAKLPVPTEFITATTGPRLGNLVLPTHTTARDVVGMNQTAAATSQAAEVEAEPSAATLAA